MTSSRLPVDSFASSASGCESESGLEEEEGDRELQLALKAGLLRGNGLNVKRESTQRPTINKTAEMDKKLAQIAKKRDWIATLDVTFSPALTYTGAVSSDFEREAAFAKQAQDSALAAISRLQTLEVPVFRPTDYFAEMAKSDEHMRKVRERLLEVQKTKERRDTAVRLREEKKFAVEVQRASEARKHKEKRKLMVAVKKHRRGMKDQLDAILNNKSRDEFDAGAEHPAGRTHGGRNKCHNKRKISRNARDKKYGYGGPKKGAKKNDKRSFEDVSFGKSKRSGQPGGRAAKGRQGRKRK